MVRSLDDLNVDAACNAPQPFAELGSLIAPVGIKLGQKRVEPKQGCHDQNPTVTILNIGRMNDRMKQKTLSIYKDMALLALDFLAAIIARRINRGPPFSALLTLWLSIMAAVGLGSRSACSRHII